MTTKRPAVLYRYRNVEDMLWLPVRRNWDQWEVWRRYDTPKAAKEALKALRKNKPVFYEFKLEEAE